MSARPTRITSRLLIGFWLVLGLATLTLVVVDLVTGDAGRSVVDRVALGCSQGYIAMLLAEKRAAQRRGYRLLERMQAVAR